MSILFTNIIITDFSNASRNSLLPKMSFISGVLANLVYSFLFLSSKLFKKSKAVLKYLLNSFPVVIICILSSPYPLPLSSSNIALVVVPLPATGSPDKAIILFLISFIIIPPFIRYHTSIL